MTPRGYLLGENLSPRLRSGFGPAVLLVHARDLGGNPGDSELWAYVTEQALTGRSTAMTPTTAAESTG